MTAADDARPTVDRSGVAMHETSACFTIGTGDHLRVTPLRRTRPGSDDYWDTNWLVARIEISAGGFRGAIDATLRAEDFARFKAELSTLYDSLRGKGSFFTMEEWLSIEIEGDGLGRFEARCSAVDALGGGNRLSFSLDFDQSEIPPILRGLRAIERSFPVIGVPPAKDGSDDA